MQRELPESTTIGSFERAYLQIAVFKAFCVCFVVFGLAAGAAVIPEHWNLL